MTMPVPLIHIGFHKTASTLLQDTLFTNAGLGFRRLENDRLKIHEAFILRGALETAPAPEVATSLQAEADRASHDGLSLVVSHERLSGYPASGGFDQAVIAQRLHAAFPKAKILMVIREQRSMIYSMYLQSISDGGTVSLRRFLSPPEPGLMRKPGFRFDFYNYDRMIRAYHELFGAENVLILPFETLRRDPQAEARKIVAHIGGDPNADVFEPAALSGVVNKGRPLAFQEIRRRLNILLRNQLSENGLITVPVTYVEKVVRASLPAAEVLRPFDRVLKSRMQSIIADACGDRFAQSNRATQQLTGLDLAGLGYVVDGMDRQTEKDRS